MIIGKTDGLIFQRSPDSIYTTLDGETVILDVDTGVYIGLNEVGTYIWDLLEAQVTVEDLRLAILKEFDVSEEECSEHILSFLQELFDNKLLEVTSEENT